MVVYDLETMGLNKDKHDISEIAMVAIDLETLEIVGTYETLIKRYSENEYSPQALETSGITEEMLKNEGKEASVVADEIEQFLKLHKVGVKPILAGHNIIKFDNGFLEKFLAAHKIKLDKLIAGKIWDTIEECKLALPDSENYQLATCCKNVGIVVKDAHRAMNDAMPNAKMVIELLKRQRGGGSVSNEIEYNRADFNLF